MIDWKRLNLEPIDGWFTFNWRKALFITCLLGLSIIIGVLTA